MRLPGNTYKQYGNIPSSQIQFRDGSYPKPNPFAPKTSVQVKLNPRDIYNTTQCDKCGSLNVLYMSRDRAYILCQECKDKLVPVLEPIYGKMSGWSGYFVRVPKAMRVISGDLLPEEVQSIRLRKKEKSVPMVQVREFPRKKRQFFSPGNIRFAWTLNPV